MIKKPAEIEKMRAAGAIVAQVLERMKELVVPGITTAAMNEEAEAMIAQAKAIPLFQGVRTRQAKFPFPSALCTSVNEQIVHGVPGDRRLVDGDVVSVDCGVKLDGWCGDSATTIRVGQVSSEVDRLLRVTYETLELALAEIRPKRWWSQVAGPMQKKVEQAGFSVVREFVGHGIGRELHEEPKVPNYYEPRERQMDFMIQQGMTLAVEPMVNMGSAQVEYEDATGWPIVTRDRQYAAHYEHTIAVTATGVEILTKIG